MWSEKDGEFDYIKFYRQLETLVGGPTVNKVHEEWQGSTIKWWNL